MIKFRFIVWLIIAFEIIIPLNVLAQNSSNGVILPAKGAVHVLMVFAELVGPCAGSGPANWPAGPAAPPNADLYLDHVVSANAVR